MIPTQQQLLNEPINFKHIYAYMVDQATYVINKTDSESTDIHVKLTKTLITQIPVAIIPMLIK